MPVAGCLRSTVALFAVRKTNTTALPFLLWPVALYFLIAINSNLNLRSCDPMAKVDCPTCTATARSPTRS